MRSTRGRVVVTGLGVVAGPPFSSGPLEQALRSPAMTCSEVDRTAGYHLQESARLAVLCRGLDLSEWVPPAMGRRMSPPSKLAVAAAQKAVHDAGLAGAVDGPRTTVVMSSAFGGVEFNERLLKVIFLERPEMVAPFTFMESVPNVAAAHIAIAVGAQGTNLTIVQREAGVLTAVGRGAAEVAAGRADCALVGGVEEMPPVLHAMLDRFNALARPGHVHGEVARPFDRHRTGFVAAEGAVVLVLEDERRARERGATIRASVRAFGSSFDPSAPRIGWGRGHASLAAALRDLLAQVDLVPSDIARVVSGACGSVAGDRLEAMTLRDTWDKKPLPAILAPKGVTGQYGGGFLASAVQAVSDAEPGPTAGFEEMDPELAVVPHRGGPLPPADFTLVTTLAAGGAASWLILERR